MAKELKDTVDVQEIHILEVLVSMRNLGGSPNYGCKYCHMVHQLEAPCRRVHSFMEGAGNPSWTYMHKGSSPLPIGSTVLHVEAPFDLNSGLIVEY